VKAFDIFSWQPDGWPEPHPAVIISSPARVTHKPEVEVLMCSSKPAGRPAQAGEIILDSADGLDWPTICKCDLVQNVKKSELKHRRGAVSPARRSQLVRQIIAAHAWGEILAS
jgi:mRNA-degrading endonuclease toxin of MazEF toxin-antitoxin module